MKGLQRDREALLASGLLTRPEALSLVTLENAVRILVDDDAVQETDEGLVGREAACRAVAERLAGMVGA